MAKLTIRLSPYIRFLFSATQSTWFWIVAIILVTLANYSYTLHIPFLLDDFATIENNPTIRHLGNLLDLVLPISGLKLAWRPISNITFALSYAISGLNPLGYHLVNIAIHTLTSLTLYAVIKETIEITESSSNNTVKPTVISGFVALLWSTHPVLTQTVNYISQRTESLMALFYLTTLFCFIRSTYKNTFIWSSLSIIACFLGILSKEVMVTTPFIILLYDRTFIAHSFKNALTKRWQLYAGLIASWIPLAILLIHIKNQSVGYGLGVGVLKYVYTESKAVIEYIKLCIWPNPLIFDRGAIFIDNLNEALPYGIILIIILGFCIWSLIKRPILGFICSCYFIILSPTSSFVPIAEEPIAENRLYLPLCSVILLYVLIVLKYLNKKLGVLILLITLALTITATYYRNTYYKSGITLWEDTIKKAPQNARAHNNLGLLLEANGNKEKAIEEYENALKLYPTFVEANNNIAILLAQIPTRRLEAISHYETALKIRPDYAEVQYNLSLVLATYPDKKEEALKHCRIAVQLSPQYSQIHNTYAALLAELSNNKEEAIQHFEEAIRLRPDFPEAHANLANILASIPSMYTKAIEEYKIALNYNPTSVQLLNNFGLLLSKRTNLRNQALEQFEKALKVDPNNIETHSNIGYILSQVPESYPEAINHFKVAIKLNPNSATANYNLAIVLIKSRGDKYEIKYHLKKALEISPNFHEAKVALQQLDD